MENTCKNHKKSSAKTGKSHHRKNKRFRVRWATRTQSTATDQANDYSRKAAAG